MPTGEFDLIRRFFQDKMQAGHWPPATAGAGVVLGVGDDCALLAPAPGQQLAVSSDLLLEGRHFLPEVDPAALGHKSLAVNLSDLAAMAATPLAFTLALALPPQRAADEAWLHAFSDGLLALAKTHGCPLVGGDTTAGPLTVCITVLGQVPVDQAPRRAGARVGDDIWVSGTLGDARLALGALRGEWSLPPELIQLARQRMERPTPRVALGQALRGLAHSAIDVSDGLLGDLGHILNASGVGACINASAVVQTAAVCTDTTASAAIPQDRLLAATLAGGDDYELVFTAAAGARDAILQAGESSRTPLTRIGQVKTDRRLLLQTDNGNLLDARQFPSFDHFA